MKKIKKYKYIIISILVLIITGSALYWFQFKTETKPKAVDPDKVMDAIKYLESGNPPRIGKTPTDEEIFNSPHIKQIRIALNGYLDGTNTGLEEGALDATTSAEMKCGLNNFSKKYYQSKFIVINAIDNDYGGVVAYIAFIDKPDAIFFVWIYGITGEQRLRIFCQEPITNTEEDKDVFNEIIKTSKYYY
jgi:hypothetical protein